MIYEYKLVKFNDINMEKLLNDFGQQGWDLCGIHEGQLVFRKSSLIWYKTEHEINTPPYEISSTGKITNNL